MGADAHVVVVGGPADLIDRAQHRLAQLEGAWSRFIDSSEVSALNRSAGSPVRVSPDTIELVRRAKAAWHLSGGAVDATVLGDVIRAGYDRSFEQVTREWHAGQSRFHLAVTDIVVDGDTVRLPSGTGFDPGGIGKGLAADMVTAEMVAGGAEGVCINMGGDVRVRGTGPDGCHWTVAVEHPWTTAPLALVGLADGAVATSTTLRRRWLVEGRPRHHLIDPQTGEPSETDLNLATVVAGDAVSAEVLAKSVLLRGSDHPFDIVGGTGAEALAVDDDGRVLSTDGLPRFLGGQRPAGHIGPGTVLATV